MQVADSEQVVEGPIGRVAFRTYGERTVRPPVVLLHGWFQAGDCWRAQIAALAEQYYVVIIDLPGHGQSTGPSSPEQGASPQLWPLSVHAVLEALGLDETPVVLAGWSFGGCVVNLYVEKYGLRSIKGIVTFGTSLAPWEGVLDPATAADIFTMIDPTQDAARRLSCFQEFLHNLTYNLPPDYETYGYNALALCKWWGVGLGGAEQIMHAGSDRQVREANLPVLIVQGKNDELMPAHTALSLHQALPSSQLLLLDACGHSAFLEKPDEVNAALLDFLASL